MNSLKKVYFLLAFTLFSLPIFSQVDMDTVAKAPAKTDHRNKKYFNSLVGSILTDVMLSPYTIEPNYVSGYSNGNYYPTSSLQGYYAWRYVEVNVVTFGYKGWYNIVEFSNNASLSLGAAPALGIGFGISAGKNDAPTGLMSLCLPVLLEFHINNGATYNTGKETGFTVGGGIEAIKAPLATVSDEVPTYYDQNQQVQTASITTAWIEPCLDAGFTFWTKNNWAVQVFVKYGFGVNTTFTDTEGETITVGGRSYQLGAIFYVGY